MNTSISPVIGREREFNDLMNSLRTGGPLEGLRSVVAPRRGGVTTFLYELECLINADDTMTAALATITDPKKFDLEMDAAVGQLGKRFTDRQWSPGLAGLWEVQAALSAEGIRPVLLVDAAEALRAIQRLSVEPDQEVTDAQLARTEILTQLRFLANHIADECSEEDGHVTLRVVVGWDDDFRGQAPAWGALDVDQRYIPTLLAPGFDRPEPDWPTYKKAVESHGVTIEGEFPGFARAGIPVGVLLDDLDKSGSARIDGTLLLETLAKRRPEADALESCPQEALIALCLQNQTIGEGHKLYGSLTDTMKQNWVVPSSQGGYVGNEQLFDALGVLPSEYRVNLETTVRRQYEDANVEDLNITVAQGLSISMDGEWHLEAPTQFSFTVPMKNSSDGVGDIIVRALVQLGHGLSDDDVDWLVDQLVELHTQRGTYHHDQKFLLVMRTSGVLDVNESAKILVQAQKKSNQIPSIQEKSGAAWRDTPQAVATLLLDQEFAVVAAYREAGVPHQQELEMQQSLVRAVRARCKAVHQMVPVLTANIERCLSKLVGHVCETRSEAQLAIDLEIPASSVRTDLRQLAALKVICDARAPEWRPSIDELLQTLGEGQTAVATRYAFREEQWNDITKALREGYGSRYVKADGASIDLVAPDVALRDRGQQVASQTREIIESLVGLDDVDPARLAENVDTLVMNLDENSSTDIASLESYCAQLVQLRHKVGEIAEQQADQRARLKGEVEAAKTLLQETISSQKELANRLSSTCDALLSNPKSDMAGMQALLTEFADFQEEVKSFEADEKERERERRDLLNELDKLLTDVTQVLDTIENFRVTLGVKAAADRCEVIKQDILLEKHELKEASKQQLEAALKRARDRLPEIYTACVNEKGVVDDWQHANHPSPVSQSLPTTIPPGTGTEAEDVQVEEPGSSGRPEIGQRPTVPPSSNEIGSETSDTTATNSAAEEAGGGSASESVAGHDGADEKPPLVPAGQRQKDAQPKPEKRERIFRRAELADCVALLRLPGVSLLDFRVETDQSNDQG